jgi:uncharacterized protein (TIGR02145 family)
MRNFILMKFHIICLILLLANTFTYSQTVVIGTQEWMNKNLDVSTFRNGDSIPQVITDEEWLKAGENEDNGQPAWCYYENNAMNGRRYGKLYNWYAVNDSRKLCPAGYHIPTDAEWSILIDYLGGEANAVNKMKSTSGWARNNGDNKSGFNALPGGDRFVDSFGNTFFEGIGMTGSWWSSTPSYYNNLAIYLCLTKDWADHIIRGANYMGRGVSIRCLRD